jgi:outer membrane protein assembly factor BamB
MAKTVSPVLWFFRVWFPFVVVGLAAVIIATVWAWPDYDQFEMLWRSVTQMMTLMVTVLLLAIWLVFFSGMRWILRLGILAGVIGLWFAIVERLDFKGDMLARVRFRWEPSRDAIREKHRDQQAKVDLPALVATGSELTDMPAFRGLARDGVAHGPPLNRDWQKSPPRQLWKQPVGGGYSAFSIAGNIAVTIEQHRDEEAIVCYDTATGQQRWVHKYPAHFKEALGGPGPRATPTLHNGEVYSLGGQGELICLDARDGTLKWAKNILKGNENIMWGMSGSPLVDETERCVYVSPGMQLDGAPDGGTLVAYAMSDGSVLGKAGTKRAGYSSPQFATLAGQRQVLLFDGERIAGYQTGKLKELWRHPWETNQGINVAQPLNFPGDRVFVSSAYGVGCAMLQIAKDDKDAWSVKELWKNKNLRCRFTSPVALGEFIYGLDEGILVCIDAKDGKRRWKGNRYYHGQILLQDNLILVLSEQGDLALVEATPDEFRELSTLHVFDTKTWNTPALANGIAYIRNHEEMACYDLRAKAEP